MDPHHLHKSWVRWCVLVTHALGGWRQAEPGGLVTRQPRQNGELLAKWRVIREDIRHQVWPLHTHVHVHTTAHVCVHTHWINERSKESCVRSSVARHLPSMCEALGSITSLTTMQESEAGAWQLWGCLGLHKGLLTRLGCNNNIY